MDLWRFQSFESKDLGPRSLGPWFSRIYIRSPNLGHYNYIGVGGESSIVKVPVSSSFGYFILESVVAQHDTMDVSRQLIKTVEFT